MQLPAPPPQSRELEMTVLGTYLVSPDAIANGIEAGDTPELYFLSRHRVIRDAILRCFESADGVTLVTVLDTLERAGKLEKIGGPAYLSELSESVATVANVQPFIVRLRDYAYRRRILKLTHALTQQANDLEATDLQASCSQLINTHLFDGVPSGAKKISELLPGALARIEAYLSKSTEKPYIQTGFVDIDNQIGGLYEGDLIIIAGRPSMGKSAFAMQVATDVAINQKRVLVFSVEMSKQQVIERQIGTLQNIDMKQVRTGTIPQREYSKIALALDPLAASQMWLCDSAHLTVHDIRAAALRIDPDLIVVDYLQMMAGDSKEGRQQEVSGISRGLKGVAKEFNCPVIALSQLSRAVELRKPPIPQLSDLRDSGTIEQDADLVMLLYRPERYGIESDSYGETKGRCDVIIDKQRNGGIGTVRLRFAPEFTRFDSIDTSHADSWAEGY